MAPAPRPRRPRRRLRWLVVLGLLAWLLGRGLGWFGRGGDAADERAREVAPAPHGPSDARITAVPSTAPGQEGTDASEPSATPTPVAPPPTPAVEVRVASVAASDEPGIDDDLFHSRLANVRHALADHDLAVALGGLQRIEGLPLRATQRALLQPVREAVQAAWTTACGDLVAAAKAGRMAVVHEQLRAWQAEAATPALAAFAAALTAAGLPMVGTAPGDGRSDTGPVPIPRPLPRGRVVRLATATGMVEGQVADSRSDSVTVRVANARGVTFPSGRRAQVEPIDPTGDEAVEQAFAALQDGEPWAARLWAAFAQGAGTADRARLAQLLTRVP